MESKSAYPDLAVPPAPDSAPPLGLRARLWLSGEALGQHDPNPRLWLHLADGRVLALRLPDVALGDDLAIAPIVAALADDLDGHLYQLNLPEVGFVQVLYAAPVLPNPSRDHAGFVFDPAFRAFADSLDKEVMRLLLTLERKPTPAAVTGGHAPHPAPPLYLASVRNYNRLAALPPRLRERRMQALARFPALVAPILLTLHHSPNLFDGKRHAWRMKSATIEAAIDQGRDLTGALAAYWDISRSLVRAPVNAAMWGGRDGGQRWRFLAFLDALPANQRPDLAEFERWLPYLASYFALLGETDEATQSRAPVAPEVHRKAFRLGFSRTWQTAAERFGNLLTALTDCDDFLHAARERAAERLKAREGPAEARLAAGWVACFGLLGLLAASRRWHRLRPVSQPDFPDFILPQILGMVEEEGRTARELSSLSQLAHEGAAMRHCVNSLQYWAASLAGTRLFHLECPNEQATAEYRPRGEDEPLYALVQLRGPENRDVSPEMDAWARRVAALINAPERQAARRAVFQARDGIGLQLQQIRRRARTHAAWPDAQSARQLERVLGEIGQLLPGPERVLCAQVAGFQYHDGPRLLNRLALGDALTLTVEPDNPHDPLAVRIDWHGRMLGYVPRPENADIAERLMRGESLAARIDALAPEAEPWRQVGFLIENELQRT